MCHDTCHDKNFNIQISSRPYSIAFPFYLSLFLCDEVYPELRIAGKVAAPPLPESKKASRHVAKDGSLGIVSFRASLDLQEHYYYQQLVQIQRADDK